MVRPLATAETPGAFLFGLRVMAVDGTVLDVPDTPANAKVFGYPVSPKGTRAAFPKIRLVLLIEAGTHLIVDALMCPYRIGERVRVKKLLCSVTSLMLPIWDARITFQPNGASNSNARMSFSQASPCQC